MTVPELIDRLQEINDSMELGSSIPKILNEHAIKDIQDNVRTLISNLEDDGIEGNEGYRMAGRVW
jgi:hypothetical protein